tara:strand:- start:27720 stop:28022 length:303 start_codon:yes stop_codon:yes gene_type:complete
MGSINTNLTSEVGKFTDYSLNRTVPLYLMASYAYYVLDKPILADHSFDSMAKIMLECWDDIEHMHKEYITKDDLRAGTFLGKYPSMAQGAAERLVKDLKL